MRFEFTARSLLRWACSRGKARPEVTVHPTGPSPLTCKVTKLHAGCGHALMVCANAAGLGLAGRCDGSIEPALPHAGRPFNFALVNIH